MTTVATPDTRNRMNTTLVMRPEQPARADAMAALNLPSCRGDSLQLKKITFSDGVLEQSKSQGQRADDFDGNVLMATSEIGQMLDELIAELDGVEK